MRYYRFPFCFLVLFLYFCIYPYALSASKIQASDIDYYIHENPSFSIIFNETFLKEQKKDFIHLHKKLSYYNDIYKEIFSKTLKEKPIYVFASPKNQISNAVTSSIPFLRVLFFPTGIEQMTRLATTAWEDTVIAHEVAHIFQLGQISDNLQFLKLIFKNSEVIFLPFPVFLNVNLTMPLFLLEGHAVLNESLFAPGGRLYSGATRALVYSQIKNKFKTTDQFTRNYLINITEDIFTNEQQYAHGGYFFNSLLQKYDIKTINNIFTKHAEHFIFPLSFVSIKDIFQSTFNTSFQSLVNYYIQKYLPLAMQQKKTPEKALFHSSICPPFNKANNKIFFLNSDLKSTPILRTLNIANGKWKKRKKIFATGKVFKINNKYYVSSSHQINTTERVYGLFSEGMYLKKYKSQSVQDIYKDQILSIDTSNNLHGFNLLLNEKFYDTVNSPALFGPEGGIYYFKQEGKQRIMYKDKTAVFQFKGFYGKLVEIDINGTIYFIAASDFGSSLFGWHYTTGIYRASASDVIIDAVKVSENQFLVCEIEPDSYTYKLIHLNETSEQPAFYDYPFETVSNSLSTLSTLSHIRSENADLSTKNVKSSDSPYLQTLQEIDKTDGLNEPDESSTTIHPQLSSLSSEQKKDPHNDISYSTYNSLRHIRFNGMDLGIAYEPIIGYNGFINIGFRDPLEYNAFHFAYHRSLENWMFQSKYVNKVYRLSWNIQYVYKEGFENFLGSRAYSYIHEFSNGLLFPVFTSGYWKSSLHIKTAIASVNLKLFPGRSFYFSVEPSVQLQYGRIYNKNFDFHRQFFLWASLQYRFKLSNDDSNIRSKIQSYYTMNWGSEFYTTPFFTYQTALKQKAIPFRYLKPLDILNSLDLNFFLKERVFAETNDYLSTGINIQKFIKTPVYFFRYPFSLRGLAPLFNGKYIQFLNNTNSQYLHFFEWTAGVKVGILIHHKVKANLNFYYGYSYPIKANFILKNKNSKKKSMENNFHFGLQLQSQF